MDPSLEKKITASTDWVVIQHKSHPAKADKKVYIESYVCL